ncbi:hypothetical protein [Altericista sp. CCNU0014]
MSFLGGPRSIGASFILVQTAGTLRLGAWQHFRKGARLCALTEANL